MGNRLLAIIWCFMVEMNVLFFSITESMQKTMSLSYLILGIFKVLFVTVLFFTSFQLLTWRHYLSGSYSRLVNDSSIVVICHFLERNFLITPCVRKDRVRRNCLMGRKILELQCSRLDEPHWRTVLIYLGNQLSEYLKRQLSPGNAYL